MPFARLLAAITIGAILLAPALTQAAGNSYRRRNNQARNRAAQLNAVNNAIKAAKVRVASAEAVANSAGALAVKRQSAAGESSVRYRNALSELDHADDEKFGSSHELAELRAKIEKFQPDDAPIKKAHQEYDEAVAALAEIRIDILESDKYLVLHESALKASDRVAELARVQKVCFDDDPEYKAAKERVERAKTTYNQIRYALYEEDPEWAPAVKRAKAATVAANKAATGVKANAVESGIERINARDAQKRLAIAQAALADARADLKQLEGRKQKLSPNKSTPTASQKNAQKKKK
jgi:hypothetical protein